MIAGYHWFTDWGRDTMISLEGLTLLTGRHGEARDILRTFAHHVRDGLIPNLFPEGENGGPLPHRRRDAVVLPRARSLRSARPATARRCRFLLPKLRDIVEHHLARHALRHRRRSGRRPARARAPTGYQLTWMDAKVGDWVVTPRRGKAVEINALWYNALRLLERLAGATERGADRRAADAARRTPSACAQSFNRRFWNADGGLPLRRRRRRGERRRRRVPPQPAVRDLAAAPGARRGALGGRCSSVVRERAADAGRAALARARAPRLQAALRRRPAGARRRLPPGHGVGLADRPVRRRLAARPSRTTAPARAALLDGLVAAPREACVGTISEIFDAEPPFTPRGCVAQAWSVAEALRALATTA